MACSSSEKMSQTYTYGILDKSQTHHDKKAPCLAESNGDMRGVFDRILLRQKPSETAATDNTRYFWACKMPSDAFDILHELRKGIWFGSGAAAMTSKVEGQNTILIRQGRVGLEIRSMVACLLSIFVSYFAEK